MTKTFTQNDLIRYLYHETSATETTEINKALICDSELQEQFKELTATKSQLDAVRLQPSPACIDNILSYARGLQEKPHS
jgi:hypothetical protein